MQKIRRSCGLTTKARRRRRSTSRCSAKIPTSATFALGRRSARGVPFTLRGRSFSRSTGPMFTFNPAVSFFVRASRAEVDTLGEALGRRRKTLRLADRQVRLSWQVIPTGAAEMLDDEDERNRIVSCRRCCR